MTRFFWIGVGVVAAAIAWLLWRRVLEVKDRDTTWSMLGAKTPWRDVPFDPSMVEALPRPARNYFRHAVAPGAPIRPVVSLKMRGFHKLRPDRAEPVQVRAYQMLAPPHGSVTRLYSGPSLFPCSGSVIIRGAFTRAGLWLLKVFPLPLDERLASGVLLERMLVEAILWNPASLLPSAQVKWTTVDDATAQVAMEIGGVLCQAEIEVSPDGQLLSVRPCNPQASMGHAIPSDFRHYDGYSLPRSVRFDGATPVLFSSVTLERVRFIEPWAGSSRS